MDSSALIKFNAKEHLAIRMTRVLGISDEVLNVSSGIVLFGLHILDLAIEANLIDFNRKLEFVQRCEKLHLINDGSGDILFKMFEEGDVPLGECVDVHEAYLKLEKGNYSLDSICKLYC